MGAMLASYTRMTYSLAVIVMETSQAINIFVPVIVTIGVANLVGAQFTRGLYDRACRAKQMPIIKKDKVPACNRQIRADKIMAKKVIYLRSVETVKNIFEALKSPHHGFPIVNINGQVIGLIPKNYLIVLISKRVYYSDQNQKFFVINGHLKKYLKENLLTGKNLLETSQMGKSHKSYRVDDDEYDKIEEERYRAQYDNHQTANSW